ncbi:uracil-DNA glycosylase family protein [Kaistella haifensis]|jgi:uracil-DNA glycosylase family 4|uniref:uracil-DNA glycosylase family protein n=1 Tax=Bacteroidota TaxID=976 RepID=UPI0009F44FD4|nr:MULTISPECIES: uracil-DNA glycosylase family protein [Bacteroidota]AZB22132.1 uracil-DNA glycosylase family protein [Kaistella haifensis]MCZ2083975.1 uracil-DNA glycosylase family protein [Flavobacteriales bacterium]MDN5397157.1 uracil-DNA glycosylase family protein [Chryseobacterium sp.]MDN3607157.1 uracil-DNA glycosylase family protein [Kaistella yonginensis]MDP2455320.1 uracil-DNA glycosylase family protein [Kaistella sp. SH11-4b]
MIEKLKDTIADCIICANFLPNRPRPIVQFSSKSKLLIIAQAPGQKAHDRGIPFDDLSGDNLRSWLGVSREQFYNPELFAIMPMGFCFPGKGKSGDLPPRKECAPQWHNKIMEQMKNLELIILVGKYAQEYYLKDNPYKNLTETVISYQEFLPKYFPLVHPSPLNFRWHGKNKWFLESITPELKKMVATILMETEEQNSMC